jgi:hypothetical protein
LIRQPGQTRTRISLGILYDSLKFPLPLNTTNFLPSLAWRRRWRRSSYAGHVSDVTETRCYRITIMPRFIRRVPDIPADTVSTRGTHDIRTRPAGFNFGLARSVDIQELIQVQQSTCQFSKGRLSGAQTCSLAVHQGLGGSALVLTRIAVQNPLPRILHSLHS